MSSIYPIRTTDRSLARLVAGAPVRLLGVWAHPDDEAYLSAGLMRRVVRSGGSVTCLMATRGEAGVAPDDPRPPSVVAAMREQELRQAIGPLGVDLLPFLGHADGGCDDVAHEVGVRQVLDAIEAVRPHVIVTFGPDGITGHADHLAIHRWATDAWARTGRGALLYTTMTRDFLEDRRALHERVGVFGDHDPVGVASSEVALTVELGEVELDVKRRALAAHASQTAGLAQAMGEDTYRTWWRTETFREPTHDEVAHATHPSSGTRFVRTSGRNAYQNVG
ncbi:MAG TPA: PIG-L family deacetylase [Acidimicrobiales bacterium]